MKYIAIILTALALTGCAHKAPEASRAADIKTYAAELRGAVQAKMYGADLYAGQSCVLQIKMQRDGQINDVESQGGDPALCQAVIKAVQAADVPAPPTDAIYNKVKNAKLDFKL